MPSKIIITYLVVLHVVIIILLGILNFNPYPANVENTVSF